MAVTVSNPALDDVPDHLQIVVSQHATTVTIALVGEWDLAKQNEAREAIHAALALHPERVVPDLSELRFIGSTGLHATVELQKLAAHQNAQLEIIPGPPAVQRPFEICRLTDVLPFQSAGASLSAAARPWRPTRSGVYELTVTQAAGDPCAVIGFEISGRRRTVAQAPASPRDRWERWP